MVSLASLWLPILLSAVFVFVASSIFHMVLPHHRGDWAKLPNEDQALDAIGKLGIPPGDYMMPCGGGPEAMKDPAFIEKMKRGPIALMTVMPSGPPSMGKNLVQWFIYLLAVSAFAAYVTSRALGPGEDYLAVFRFAGSTAFAAYTFAHWQESIWYKRKWSTTLKNVVDGLVYALLTAGVFGWLWPV